MSVPEIVVDDPRGAFLWLLRKCQAANWRAFKRSLPMKATDVPIAGHVLVRKKPVEPMQARRYGGPGRVERQDGSAVNPGDIILSSGFAQHIIRPDQFEREYERAEP